MPRSSLDDTLREYVRAVRAQGSHQGKVYQFIRFLEKAFQLVERAIPLCSSRAPTPSGAGCDT